MSEGRLPVLISVDWGTSSLRCMLVDSEGVVLDHDASDLGILNCGERSFGDVLAGKIARWFQRFRGDALIPVLMSGMIGSRQGWQEADYLRCPASPQDLARNLLIVDAGTTALERCDIRIVPGMDIAGVAANRSLPDVMRGEETQVFGALLGAGISDGVFVLPGTHSKWVFVEDGAITKFYTYMTGEIYAALLDATILGKLIDDSDSSEDGFALGVETARDVGEWAGPGQLLNMVFTARSRVLHSELEQTAIRSYLSGLLIGAELLSGIKAGSVTGRAPEAVFLIGDRSLCSRYETAAALLGDDTGDKMGGKMQVFEQDPVPVAHLAISRLAASVA